MARTPLDPDRDLREFRSTGDPAALARVFDALAGRLLLAAGHLCDDATTAEDMVQATFVAAIESVERFDPRHKALPWFLGILANRARGDRRRRRRRAALLRERAEGREQDTGDPAELLCAREAEAALAAALREIPAPYREVLNLRHAHDLSPTEIAHALDRPLATVKSQLQRGVERLRLMLPAAFAPALAALLTPERGLAAMRDAVLATAGARTAVPTTLLTLSLAMKKTLAAALACVLFLAVMSYAAGWWEATTIAGVEAPTPELRAGGPVTHTATAKGAGSQPSTPEGDREAIPAPTGRLRLRLVWADDGAPAAGIGCRVFPRGAASGKHLGTHECSDAEGNVDFEELPPGTYTVCVTKERQPVVRILGGQTATETVRLPSFGTLTGAVVTDAGAPLAGARVVHRYSPHDTKSLLAVTGDDGRFAARLCDKDVSLRAERSGYGSSKLEILHSDPGEHHELTFFMIATDGALRGTVIDPGGRPVAAADVYMDMQEPPTIGRHFLEQSHARDFHTRTDAAGRFTFENVQPGEVVLEIRAAGFACLRQSTTQPTAGDHAITVQLQQEAALAGTVRDAAGRPVGGVTVVTTMEPAEMRYAPQAVSDGRGRYALGSLPAGATAVVFRHDAHGTTRLDLELAAGTTRRDVSLVAGPTLHGVVFDGGAPAAGWTLQATARRGDAPRDHRRWRRTTTTAADGRFRLPNCEWEEYSLELLQPTDRGQPLPRGALMVARPGPTPLRIDAEPGTRPSARVKGRVQRPEGHEDARVRLALQGTALRVYRSLRVAADGTFESAKLPAGRYTLATQSHASDLGGLPEREVELAAGATLDVGTLVLPRPTTVHPIVRRADGGRVPPISMAIKARPDKAAFSGIWFGRWLESRGAVPAGRVDLELWNSPVNMTIRVPLEITAGRDHRPVIELPPVQPVRFRLVPERGVALPEACRLSIQRTGGGILDESLYVHTGRSRVFGLVPGHYRLELIGNKDLTGGGDLEVPRTPAGEVREVEIRIGAR